jgi:hypothetical protein
MTMFDLDLLDRLDTGLARIAPADARSEPRVCTRLAAAPVEEVVRCPELLARGVCPMAHGPREEVPA